jgi:pyridoxine/pyridoxamine 5'-phosphate oxidase
MPPMDRSHLRQDCRQTGLHRSELHAEPMQQLRRWFEQANAAKLLGRPIPHCWLATVVWADGDSTRVNVGNLERQPGTVPLQER